MNNHKFRAWDDTLLRYLPPMTIEEIGKCNMNGTNWYQLTLEQWIGLYDKNGTEIYVGDKLSVISSTLDGEVRLWKTTIKSILDFGIMRNLCYANEIEIIGHIHEGEVF